MPLRRPSYYVPANHDPELVAAVGFMAGDPDLVNVHVLDLHSAPTLVAHHEVELSGSSLAPVLMTLVGLGFISMSAVVGVARSHREAEEPPSESFDLGCLLYALRRDRRDLKEWQFDA